MIYDKRRNEETANIKNIDRRLHFCSRFVILLTDPAD